MRDIYPGQEHTFHEGGRKATCSYDRECCENLHAAMVGAQSKPEAPDASSRCSQVPGMRTENSPKRSSWIRGQASDPSFSSASPKFKIERVAASIAQPAGLPCQSTCPRINILLGWQDKSMIEVGDLYVQSLRVWEFQGLDPRPAEVQWLRNDEAFSQVAEETSTHKRRQTSSSDEPMNIISKCALICPKLVNGVVDSVEKALDSNSVGNLCFLVSRTHHPHLKIMKPDEVHGELEAVGIFLSFEYVMIIEVLTSHSIEQSSDGTHQSVIQHTNSKREVPPCLRDTQTVEGNNTPFHHLEHAIPMSNVPWIVSTHRAQWRKLDKETRHKSRREIVWSSIVLVCLDKHVVDSFVMTFRAGSGAIQCWNMRR
jgi:hypothetical protein